MIRSHVLSVLKGASSQVKCLYQHKEIHVRAYSHTCLLFTYM